MPAWRKHRSKNIDVNLFEAGIRRREFTGGQSLVPVRIRVMALRTSFGPRKKIFVHGRSDV